MKQRVHNEWFMLLVKRSCLCGCKKTQVFAWGEYVCARWRTVEHFCAACYQERVFSRLSSHLQGCGCSFSLRAKNFDEKDYPWLFLPSGEMKGCAA